jgi:hypothetical protein
VPDDDYEWKSGQDKGLPALLQANFRSGGTGYLYFRNSCRQQAPAANSNSANAVPQRSPRRCQLPFSFDLYMNTKTGLMSNLAGSSAGGAIMDGGENLGNQGKLWRRDMSAERVRRK